MRVVHLIKIPRLIARSAFDHTIQEVGPTWATTVNAIRAPDRGTRAAMSRTADLLPITYW
jgi:hypothetical protein